MKEVEIENRIDKKSKSKSGKEEDGEKRPGEKATPTVPLSETEIH